MTNPVEKSDWTSVVTATLDSEASLGAKIAKLVGCREPYVLAIDEANADRRREAAKCTFGSLSLNSQVILIAAAFKHGPVFHTLNDGRWAALVRILLDLEVKHPEKGYMAVAREIEGRTTNLLDCY